MKRNMLLMNKLKRIDPSIEPCGSPAITSFKLLNLSLIWTLCLLFSGNYTWNLILVLTKHMPLVLLVEGHYLYHQKPLRDLQIWLTYFLLYLRLFSIFSSMTIKECCALYKFLKPMTHFEILLFIKLLICL